MPALGQTFAGPCVDSATRARQLNRDDATIYLGPRLCNNGREFRVPSPAQVQAAIQRWKALGGRFEDTGGITPFWFIPKRAIDLAELDRLYREFYPASVQAASMRLVFGDFDLHDKIRRILEVRRIRARQGDQR